MYDLIHFSTQYHLDWIFAALAILMIWIDYYFFVDWPAFVGYLLFGLAAIIMAPFTLGVSVAVGCGIFVLFLFLHVLVFSKYLTNASN